MQAAEKDTALIVPEGARRPIAAPNVGADAGALMKIIDRAAMDPTFDVAKLEQLLAMKERWEANEARKAFNESFSAFKAEAIHVLKNKTVTDGPLKGKSYAELFSVVNAVTPLLAKHGLSHSWKLTKDEKDWIEVTCTLEHVLGHSKSVSMGGPPDTGGAKNAIQARASATTYLERYTLKAVCGVAEQGDDTDGNSRARLDESVLATLLKSIDEAKDEAGLLTAYKAAWKAADDINDKAARQLIGEHKARRQAALKGKS